MVPFSLADTAKNAKHVHDRQSCMLAPTLLPDCPDTGEIVTDRTSTHEILFYRDTTPQPGVEKGQNEAFEDVQLGPLLGQGGFGKVYRGLWNGAAVAVKVRYLHALLYHTLQHCTVLYCTILYCTIK